MTKDLGLRYIRRTKTFKPLAGHQARSWYEWWNKDDGWTRSQLDASALFLDEAQVILRQLKMADDPYVIQTIMLPVVASV